MEDALTILTAKPDALSVTAGSYDPERLPYQRDGRQLTLTPELLFGWRWNRGRSSATQFVVLEPVGEIRVGVTVSLVAVASVASPGWHPTLTNQRGSIPNNSYIGATDALTYSVEHHRLRVNVPLMDERNQLNPTLGWRAGGHGCAFAEGRTRISTGWYFRVAHYGPHGQDEHPTSDEVELSVVLVRETMRLGAFKGLGRFLSRGRSRDE